MLSHIIIDILQKQLKSAFAETVSSQLLYISHHALHFYLKYSSQSLTLQTDNGTDHAITIWNSPVPFSTSNFP